MTCDLCFVPAVSCIIWKFDRFLLDGLLSFRHKTLHVCSNCQQKSGILATFTVMKGQHLKRQPCRIFMWQFDLTDKLDTKLLCFSSPQSLWKLNLKDGVYYCYCAYVMRISRYSDFLSPMLTNREIFLRGLKLSGESRS